MATRRATKSYNDIQTFLEDYNTSFSKNMITIDSSCYRGDELANEIKLDLRLPDKTRVGPIGAQVVFRGEDGTVALRIVELPDAVHAQFEAAQKSIESEVQGLVDQGLVVRMSVHQKMIADYEEKLVTLKQDMEKQLSEAIKQANQMAAAAALNSSDGSTPVLQRGFLLPSFEGAEPSFSGQMGDRFLEALLTIQANNQTGLLRIASGEQIRYAYWDRGGIVGWKNEPIIEKEVLGMLLYQNKQISKEQLSESLEMMEEKGVRQGEAFIQMGVMTFSQMVMVLGKQVEFILQRILGLGTGSFEFFPLEGLPERFVPPPLKPARVLYRRSLEQAAEMRQNELNNVVSQYFNQYVHLTPLAISIVQQISWKTSEQKLLKVITSSSWRLREIFSMSPLTKRNTYSFVWTFIRLKLFRFEGSEASSRSDERYDLRISRKKKQLQGGSHFDILETHWISVKNEIEHNYKRLANEFDVSRHPDIPSQFHDDMERILKRIQQSYAVLKEDRSRREYRLKMIEKDKVVQSAELLSKKGEMAIMRRDRREGILCFSKALELVPGRADFLDGLRRSTSISSL